MLRVCDPWDQYCVLDLHSAEMWCSSTGSSSTSDSTAPQSWLQ